MTSAVLSILAEPVEHLLRVIQRLDAAGGILRVLLGDANPFTKCLRDLCCFLLPSSADSRLLRLFRHYGYSAEERAAPWELKVCAASSNFASSAIVYFLTHLQLASLRARSVNLSLSS